MSHMSHNGSCESGEVIILLWGCGQYPCLTLSQVLGCRGGWYKLMRGDASCGPQYDHIGHVTFLLLCYRVVLRLGLNFTPNKNQAWHRSNRGGQKKASACVAAPSSDFLIASAAITIADQPSRPAPTAHTVAHIAPTGITTHQEFEQESSRLLGTAPYPTFQRSQSLMSRLGVTPTIETSKKFEEITRQEEQEEQRRIRNMFLNPAPAQQDDVEMQEVEIQKPDSDNESVVSWGNTLPCPLIPHGIHVEWIYSMWNPWNPHGIHMEYVSPHKSCTYWYGFHMESTWNPHGLIPCGMHLIFQLILKSDSKF